MDIEYEKIAQDYLDAKWPKDESGQHRLYCLQGKEQQRERFFFVSSLKDDVGTIYRISDDSIRTMLLLWLNNNYPQHNDKFRYSFAHINRVLRYIKQVTRVPFRGDQL